MVVELGIALAVFITVMALGGAIVAARRAKRGPLEERLRELEGEPAPSVAAKKAPPLMGLIGRIGKAASSGKASRKLVMELTKAGYSNPHAAATYIGVKVLAASIGLVGLLIGLAPTSLSTPAKIFLTIAGAAALSFAPNIVISARQRKRQAEVQNHLPDMLDLIEICVSAGMGMDMAWNSVTDEVRQVSPILSDEMALTNLEIHLGSPRGEAMRHMAERTDNEELSSLVAILVQSERFGTSVADALRTFAESVRAERSRRAEEYAEKMAVKLLVPMILFIFPTILVVVVGPAGMTLARMLLED